MWKARSVLMGLLLVPHAASGQAAPADTVRNLPPFFTWRDGLMAVAFAGGTIALRPLDKKLAQTFRSENAQANKIARKITWGVEWFGKPLPIVIGTGMYAVGRIGKMERVADLGLHGTEALVMGGVVTTTIKLLAGRARPSANPDDPYDFKFLRGFKGGQYTSFPSGHTTGAFAAAAAVTAEANRWWPGSRWYVGPVMFTGAGMVGMSRMYHNGHWASDVMTGAAIGTFSGLKVVRYNHRNPENRINRWLLNFTVVPGKRVSWQLVPQPYIKPVR
jgi:membrane-associated phospholipid phosphatase